MHCHSICILPEGSIETRCKLGRVRHQADLVCDSLQDQSILDRLDTTVHHITGSNHLASGTSIGQGDVCKSLDRGSVVDGSILTQDSTVSMRGVRAQADIASQKKVGESLAENVQCTDSGGIGIVGSGSNAILGR